MRSLPLIRTEYWNLSTNTVRSGATAHGESLTDVDNYLLPQAQVHASSLYTWGVADGLSVSAVPNQPSLTISPGVALDAAGHLIALAANGFAVVDPTVDPNQVQNIPTVPVALNGVVLSTTGLSGECFLTLTWREVLGQSQLANAPVLLHAPWLRLLGVAGFQDTGDQVILARVTLDNTGLVTALAVDGRRLVGLPASRLELRCPHAAPAPTLSVDHLPASELCARPDGGLELNLLLPNGPPRPALTVEGLTGNLVLAPQGGNVGIGTNTPLQKLHVAGSFLQVDGAGGEQVYIGGDGSGSDVQLGSMNPNVQNVAVWNQSAGTRMNLFAADFIKVSDSRQKKNVRAISRALPQVTQLRGVIYEKHEQGTHRDSRDVGSHIGFIAQEVNAILPEVVSQDSKGMYGISYTSLIPLVVEAIKEQQHTILRLQEELEVIKKGKVVQSC